MLFIVGDRDFLGIRWHLHRRLSCPQLTDSKESDCISNVIVFSGDGGGSWHARAQASVYTVAPKCPVHGAQAPSLGSAYRQSSAGLDPDCSEGPRLDFRLRGRGCMSSQACRGRAAVNAPTTTAQQRLRN